jgi:molybdopterin synthase catalytic subunit
MSVQVHIIDGPLPPSTPLDAGTGPEGAVASFEGIVRAEEDSRPIAALDYEVYEPMARRELQRLARQVHDDFALLTMDVEHSRGRVPVGLCSFRLRITATHRKEALQAMDLFIDRMKQDVPIWKTPVFQEQPQRSETERRS